MSAVARLREAGLPCPIVSLRRLVSGEPVPALLAIQIVGAPTTPAPERGEGSAAITIDAHRRDPLANLNLVETDFGYAELMAAAALSPCWRRLRPRRARALGGRTCDGADEVLRRGFPSALSRRNCAMSRRLRTAAFPKLREVHRRHLQWPRNVEFGRMPCPSRGHSRWRSEETARSTEHFRGHRRP